MNVGGSAERQAAGKGTDSKECKTALKAGLVALLFVLAGTAVQAQDRLEPARGYPADYPLSLRFYEQETWRLLHVRNATWGVICLPSFFPESSIVYDERAQALVLTAVEGTTLWRNVTQATEERIDKGRFIDIVPLDEPRNYQTPSLKTTVLPVSGTLAQKLERLWNASGFVRCRHTTPKCRTLKVLLPKKQKVFSYSYSFWLICDIWIVKASLYLIFAYFIQPVAQTSIKR